MSISPQPFVPPRQHLPPGTGLLAMWLFIAALGMLFISSIIGYIIIRVGGPNSPRDFHKLEIPTALWLSSFILLLSSLTIHMAVTAVRREMQKRFQGLLLMTLILSLVFVMVQAPALYKLWQTHWDILEKAAQASQHQPMTLVGDQAANVDNGKPNTLYGLIFCLIILHAFHVLGGIIPLAVVTIKSHASRYDHEHHNPIRYLAIYWHFLDIVWLVMFGVMMILG